MRNENQIIKHLPSTPPFFNFTPEFSGAGWNCLPQTPLPPFSQKPPLKSPVTKTWPPKPNTQKHSATKTIRLIKVNDD